MLPVPNCLQYSLSFLGMYQHLFICHLLCPTDFQHPRVSNDRDDSWTQSGLLSKVNDEIKDSISGGSGRPSLIFCYKKVK